MSFQIFCLFQINFLGKSFSNTIRLSNSLNQINLMFQKSFDRTNSENVMSLDKENISWTLVDWLQSLKQFFINVSNHILVASLTLMALFYETEPSELDWLQVYDLTH